MKTARKCTRCEHWAREAWTPWCCSFLFYLWRLLESGV